VLVHSASPRKEHPSLPGGSFRRVRTKAPHQLGFAETGIAPPGHNEKRKPPVRKEPHQ